MFGSSTGFSFGGTTAAAPAAGGFSLGGGSTASTGFGAAPAATGFGAAPAATGFGAAPAATGFGAAAPAATGFGAAAPAATGFGFGAATPAASTTGLGGGFSLGGATAAAGGLGGATALGGAGAAAAALKLDSKYEELPEELKKYVLDIDQYIRKEAGLRKDIRVLFDQRSFDLNVKEPMQKLVALNNDIQAETNAIGRLQEEVRVELKHAEEASRKHDKLTMSTVARLQETIFLPSQFHWSKLASFEDRVHKIQQQIMELDQYWANAAAAGAGDGANALKEAMQGQHDALIAISSTVSRLHQYADQIREVYKEMIQRKGGETKLLFVPPKAKPDPFEEYKEPEPKPAAPHQLQQPAGAFGMPAASGGFGLGGASTTGFGAAATTGFGATPAAATTGFGGGGFGAAATTGFGASTGFGSANGSKKSTGSGRKKRGGR